MLRVDELEGKTLGRYEIHRQVGDGGYAVVYKAWHQDFHTWVALKFLKHDIAKDEVARERFKKEARLQFRLQHPNIVRVIEMLEEERLLGMAMDWIEGSDLEHYLKMRGGRLNIEEIKRIFLPLLDGIGYAHEHKIIHRDLKPPNILIHGEKGHEIPKVMDFGIAKSLEDGKNQTQTGSILGTPNYIAPEQINAAKHADHRADIYSLGITLYQAITGHLPFIGRDFLHLLAAHLMEPPPPFKKWGFKNAPSLEAVVFKALQKQPEQRYPSCKDFAQELQDALQKDRSLEESFPTVAFEATLPHDVQVPSTETLRSLSTPPQKTPHPQLPTGDISSYLEETSTPTQAQTTSTHNHTQPPPQRQPPQEQETAIRPAKMGYWTQARTFGAAICLLSLGISSLFLVRIIYTTPSPPPNKPLPSAALNTKKRTQTLPPLAPKDLTRKPPLASTPTAKRPQQPPPRIQMPTRQTPLLKRKRRLAAAPKRRAHQKPSLSKRAPKRCIRCLQIFSKRYFSSLGTQTPCSLQGIQSAAIACKTRCAKDILSFCSSYGKLRVAIFPGGPAQRLSKRSVCRMQLQQNLGRIARIAGYSKLATKQQLFCLQVFSR